MNTNRNPMTVKDVNYHTPIDTMKYPRFAYGTEKRRPVVVGVWAIKPCGCEGPYLGTVEIVSPLKKNRLLNYNPPRTWNPSEMGYELRQEIKGRAGLYLDGKRLFGKLVYGATGKALNRLFKQLSWNHYREQRRQELSPRKADGYEHKTIADAMERIPRSGTIKLWAIRPENRNGHWERRKNPVGYVWGEEQATLALRNWHAVKNAEDAVLKEIAS